MVLTNKHFLKKLWQGITLLGTLFAFAQNQPSGLTIFNSNAFYAAEGSIAVNGTLYVVDKDITTLQSTQVTEAPTTAPKKIKTLKKNRKPNPTQTVHKTQKTKNIPQKLHITAPWNGLGFPLSSGTQYANTSATIPPVSQNTYKKNISQSLIISTFTIHSSHSPKPFYTKPKLPVYIQPHYTTYTHQLFSRPPPVV